MPASNRSNFLYNPILGLLPYLVYVILHAFMVNEPIALLASLSLSIALQLYLYYRFQTRLLSITHHIASIAFFLTAIAYLFDSYIPNKNIYIVICETSIVCQFILFRIAKSSISMLFLRKQDSFYRIYLSELYTVIALTQYLFTAHLFFILIYQSFQGIDAGDTIINFVTFSVVPTIIVAALIAYEWSRLNKIRAKLAQEEWLPIVNEKGEVYGRIAKSVSVEQKSKYRHPIVRIALISNGKIFLQSRSKTAILDPGKIDYPFEKYVLYNNDISIAVQNCLKRTLGYTIGVSPKFILKYEFENEQTKRLIFLYALNIDDENAIERTEKMHGKFWTIKQIEEAFADAIFSECFELEFEYMKNTVVNPLEEMKAIL